MPRRNGQYYSDATRKHFYGDLCIYCGEIADTKEHFPPVSYTNAGWILPCCMECNSFASNLHPTDWDERVLLVRMKIERQYEPYMSCPEWSDKEVAEVGYNLGTSVKICQHTKIVAQRKLAWNVEAYLELIAPDNDFADLPVECEAITEEEKQSWRR